MRYDRILNHAFFHSLVQAANTPGKIPLQTVVTPPAAPEASELEETATIPFVQERERSSDSLASKAASYSCRGQGLLRVQRIRGLGLKSCFWGEWGSRVQEVSDS